MSGLLQLIKIETKKVPLMVELQVDPTIAPYLVSSTKSFIWLKKPLRNNFLRVAVRNETLENLYGEIAQSIYETGKDCKWENSYSLSKMGLRRAIEYLDYYGIKDLEILSCDTDPLGIGSSFDKLPVSKVSWLDNCYLVVPQDRSYLGSVSDFGDGNYAVLIHNPSRGIAFSL